MTVVNPRSISGINSITMASGDGNLLTIHTTNTTERVKINSDGDVIVGSGITVSPDGDVFATGVCTATTFSGSGASLTNLPAANLTGTLPAISGANLTGITQTTINNNANNRLITGSGTANTLEAETNIIFDGTNLDSGATTDNSVKTGTLRVNHYTHSATNPINVIGCSSGNGYNNIQIGGNDTSFSGTAATGIRFYTGGTATTANGTLRGYFDTGGNFGISNGDLVIGTGGKGIDFSAQTTSTASGVTAATSSGDERLEHYEQGTWSASVRAEQNGTASTSTTNDSRYVRIGNFVHCVAYFTVSAYAAGTTNGSLYLTGLPFVNTANHGAAHFHFYAGLGQNFNVLTGTVQANTAEVLVRGNTSESNATDAVDFDATVSANDAIIFSCNYVTS